MNMKIQLNNIAATDEPFARAMGISKEREAEIEAAIRHYYTESEGNDLQAIQSISADMNNSNELAFAMLLYGIAAGSANAEETLINKLVA